jgi:hypothetical protein
MYLQITHNFEKTLVIVERKEEITEKMMIVEMIVEVKDEISKSEAINETTMIVGMNMMMTKMKEMKQETTKAVVIPKKKQNHPDIK